MARNRNKKNNRSKKGAVKGSNNYRQVPLAPGMTDFEKSVRDPWGCPPCRPTNGESQYAINGKSHEYVSTTAASTSSTIDIVSCIATGNSEYPLITANRNDGVWDNATIATGTCAPIFASTHRFNDNCAGVQLAYNGTVLNCSGIVHMARFNPYEGDTDKNTIQEMIERVGVSVNTLMIQPSYVSFPVSALLNKPARSLHIPVNNYMNFNKGVYAPKTPIYTSDYSDVRSADLGAIVFSIQGLTAGTSVSFQTASNWSAYPGGMSTSLYASTATPAPRANLGALGRASAWLARTSTVYFPDMQQKAVEYGTNYFKRKIMESVQGSSRMIEL